MNYRSFFKKISIRGRLAFAAMCVENVFKKENVSGKIPERILNEIWEFTRSSTLDVWERRIIYVTPCCLLEDDFEPGDFEFFTEPELRGFTIFFRSLPAYVNDMIDCTIEVGASNIYGGTGAYSECTLDFLMEVIELAISNGINLPDHNLVSEYSFVEKHGWGQYFSKKDIFTETD